jgi:DTW domain-containing protein YfiP
MIETVVEACPRCAKVPDLCVCASVAALGELATRVHVLILQHPQEPDKDLGSARLAHLSLPNSTLKTGLSWANLKKASGCEQAQSSRWAVLYLGSGIKGKAHSPEAAVAAAQERLQFVNKVGASIPAPAEPLEGIVILDGTWSQAKTLWWRNAWLLKLRRVVLTPQYKSLYKELRKEPRRECLSTIEAIAECATALGEPEAVEKGLKKVFADLLDRQRARAKARKQARQKPAPEITATASRPAAE